MHYNIFMHCFPPLCRRVGKRERGRRRKWAPKGGPAKWARAAEKPGGAGLESRGRGAGAGERKVGKCARGGEKLGPEGRGGEWGHEWRGGPGGQAGDSRRGGGTGMPFGTLEGKSDMHDVAVALLVQDHKLVAPGFPFCAIKEARMQMLMYFHNSEVLPANSRLEDQGVGVQALKCRFPLVIVLNRAPLTCSRK